VPCVYVCMPSIIRSVLFSCLLQEQSWCFRTCFSFQHHYKFPTFWIRTFWVPTPLPTQHNLFVDYVLITSYLNRPVCVLLLTDIGSYWCCFPHYFVLPGKTAKGKASPFSNYILLKEAIVLHSIVFFQPSILWLFFSVSCFFINKSSFFFNIDSLRARYSNVLKGSNWRRKKTCGKACTGVQCFYDNLSCIDILIFALLFKRPICPFKFPLAAYFFFPPSFSFTFLTLVPHYFLCNVRHAFSRHTKRIRTLEQAVLALM